MIDDLVDATWDRELNDLFLRIGHRFGRADLRRRMRDYVRALPALSAAKTSGNWSNTQATVPVTASNGYSTGPPGTPTTSATTCRHRSPTHSAKTTGCSSSTTQASSRKAPPPQASSASTPAPPASHRPGESLDLALAPLLRTRIHGGTR
ncbi:hypothetical protein [Streptomyces sp. L2]|uniref:hypothetical protein n=1 Tax=Streptomyces sp. L2 TaxID=2162665 RepID=UPI001F505A29|nr:hypothetical protein [Streptomyces sp. L2]